jgi:hypothetical protein
MSSSLVQPISKSTRRQRMLQPIVQTQHGLAIDDARRSAPPSRDRCN